MQVPPGQSLRAGLFNLCFYFWTVVLALALLPAAPFAGAPAVRAYARFWMRGTQALLRRIVGLDHEVRGLERLPPGPVIIASKHQSAWETLFFHLVRPDLVIGLKEELTRIPIFGWYLTIAGNIRIDRGGAGRALRSLLVGARRAVARGESVLIFPEGTRMPVEAPPAYKSGVAALYKALDVPCVPVALNSGVYWGRRSFLKRPGRILVEFLEPIPPGLPREEFMRLLEERIETATARLVSEARGVAGRSPGLEHVGLRGEGSR